MPLSIVRGPLVALTMALPILLTGCAAPSKPDSTPVVVAPAPAPAPASAPMTPVMPVEVEPVAPAVRPESLFAQLTQGPESAMLAYADKVRSMGGPELTAELARLGDPGDAPNLQMRVALVLAQTRVPADLARALGLLQRVASNPTSDARPLQPLARLLSSRYLEQRRVEDDRDRQAQQVRDSQRRIDQLNDRLEALRAIERSFARPSNSTTSPPAAAPNGARPAQ